MSEKEPPLLRRECDHCDLRSEVTNLKGWTGRIDKRLWAFGTGLVLILITTVINLFVLLAK